MRRVRTCLIFFFQKLWKKIKRMFPIFDFFVQYNKCGQACICFICVTFQLCTASPTEQWTTMSSSKQNKLLRFRVYPGIYFWFSYTRIMLSAYDSRSTHQQTVHVICLLSFISFQVCQNRWNSSRSKSYLAVWIELIKNNGVLWLLLWELDRRGSAAGFYLCRKTTYQELDELDVISCFCCFLGNTI